MKVSIVTIGDEILIGQIVDTNSAYMGTVLNEIGLEIKEILTISDSEEAIFSALDRCLADTEVVLMTGGLGPTKDDVTKVSLAKYFGASMVMNEGIFAHIERYLGSKGRPILQSHKDMALVPSNCEVLQNAVGTAAAMWFEENDKILVSMPGVPYEMKDFMKRHVIPRLSKKSKKQVIHKTLMTTGIGESIIAEKIKDVESSLPDHVKLAYLPRIGGVRLRLSGSGSALDLPEQLDSYGEKIKLQLSKYYYTDEDTTLEAWLGSYLSSQGHSLCTAESCTGGNIARVLTKYAGASSFYQGSVIAYSNQLKQRLLNVSAETLENFGAVSGQTVTEMAKGALELMDTDYVIAVSGIAGPTGGTAQKPVGTVWIAVGSRKGEIVPKCFTYPGNREMVIQGTTQLALNQLRKLIFGLL